MGQNCPTCVSTIQHSLSSTALEFRERGRCEHILANRLAIVADASVVMTSLLLRRQLGLRRCSQQGAPAVFRFYDHFRLQFDLRVDRWMAPLIYRQSMHSPARSADHTPLRHLGFPVLWLILGCRNCVVVHINRKPGLWCLSSTDLQLVHVDHLARTVARLLYRHVCGGYCIYNKHFRPLGRPPFISQWIKIPHPLTDAKLPPHEFTVVDILPPIRLHIETHPSNSVCPPVTLLCISDKLVRACPRFFFICRCSKMMATGARTSLPSIIKCGVNPVTTCSVSSCCRW